MDKQLLNPVLADLVLLHSTSSHFLLRSAPHLMYSILVTAATVAGAEACEGASEPS